MEWISVKKALPPIPERPYKLYLAWATSSYCVEQHEAGHLPWGFSGVPHVVQFSRDNGEFLPIPGLVITHWAEVVPPDGVPIFPE